MEERWFLEDEQGYNVATSSRDVSKLDNLPSGVVKICLDVCDLNSCQSAIDEVVKKLGSTDVLVNNAGLSHLSNFDETPDDVADLIMETNYWGGGVICVNVLSPI